MVRKIVEKRFWLTGSTLVEVIVSAVLLLLIFGLFTVTLAVVQKSKLTREAIILNCYIPEDTLDTTTNDLLTGYTIEEKTYFFDNIMIKSYLVKDKNNHSILLYSRFVDSKKVTDMFQY